MYPELTPTLPILERLGLTLEERQPHLRGERHLMQAVTTASGQKMILIGQRVSDKKRVVIKITNDTAGMNELRHERECRDVLHQIKFAYQTFLTPPELFYGIESGYLISVQEFIEATPFLDRPLKEQFALALKSFKAQESAHATTYKHIKRIKRTFGSMDAKGYLKLFTTFDAPPEAEAFLRSHMLTIEQYCGFLTHTDFVPHNIRVAGDAIYLLDHSSLRFGNKYEGWARFINFMELYNPPLARALEQYVKDNRAPGESVALRAMRVYRLGEIIWYYKDKVTKSSGDLQKLNEARVVFWSDVLASVLSGRELSPEVRQRYIETRDSLRSEDEKQRQIGLH